MFCVKAVVLRMYVYIGQSNRGILLSNNNYIAKVTTYITSAHSYISGRVFSSNNHYTFV